MMPRLFRAVRWLDRLTALAVGLSLAAATCAAFGVSEPRDVSCLLVGASTLFFGTLWAHLLRASRPAGDSSDLPRWLLSLPLAVANAALSAGLVFGASPRDGGFGSFLLGMFAGVTAGAGVWGPALLLTLLGYGPPIAWARRSARRGLAGLERGTVAVGAVSVLVALAAVVVSQATRPPHRTPHLAFPWAAEAFAVAAAACGGLVVAVSLARAQRRRAFVAEVEAGRVEGFRIETTDEVRALVRYAPGENYRVADVTEDIAALEREDVARTRREPTKG